MLYIMFSQQHGLNCQPDKFKKFKKNEIVDCIIKNGFKNINEFH